jgi:ATP/maltotriose-dependent transcriptional regulator MalT
LAAVDRLPNALDDGQLLAIQAKADPIGRGALFLERLEHAMPTLDVDADTLRHLGSAFTVVPEVHNARIVLERAVAAARDEGRMGLVAQTLTSLGDAALYSGDWDLTLQATDECARLAGDIGKPIWSGFAHLTQGTLMAMRGEEERSLWLIAEANRALTPLALAPFDTYFAIARSAVAASAGRYTEAFEQIRRAFDPTETAYDLLIGSRGLIDLVEAAVRIGQQDYARRAVDELEKVVHRNGSPFIATSVNYARPMLADDETAEALYVSALADQPVRIPFLRARVLLDYGMWLRRQRRVTDSHDPLRSARDGFDAIGAASWAERARQQLRASGEKSPRRSPERRDELTPQELQIAAMVAEGLTNREIAERLFLSHRTVGSHLYRIFPKLGISSRSEITRALVGLDESLQSVSGRSSPSR